MAAPPPARRLEARLVLAQDILAGTGLVIGIVVSAVSLWALISKYRARRLQPPRQVQWVR